MDMNNYKYVFTMLIIMSLNVKGLKNIDKTNNVFAAIKSKHSLLLFCKKHFEMINSLKTINIYGKGQYFTIIIIITEEV